MKRLHLFRVFFDKNKECSTDVLAEDIWEINDLLYPRDQGREIHYVELIISEINEIRGFSHYIYNYSNKNQKYVYKVCEVLYKIPLNNKDDYIFVFNDSFFLDNARIVNVEKADHASPKFYTIKKLMLFNMSESISGDYVEACFDFCDPDEKNSYKVHINNSVLKFLNPIEQRGFYIIRDPFINEGDSFYCKI